MQVRRRALAGLVVLVAGEAAAVALLVHLGAAHPFDLGASLDAWSAAAPEDALAAALRWVALAATAWLLVATLVDVATVVCTRGRVPGAGVARAPAARRRVAPRAVRRLVDRALLAGMAVGVTMTAPGVAHAQRVREPVPPVVTVVRDGRAGGLASLPADSGTDRTAGRPRTPSTTPAPSPPPPAPPPVAPPAPAGAVVAPGDSLWEIAARAVARATGRARADVPDHEVGLYWIAVCDANAPHLASGDPDVLLVGEVVVLPPFA